MGEADGDAESGLNVASLRGDSASHSKEGRRMRYTHLCHKAKGLTTVVAPAASRAQITALGAMGDSLSDEYAEETYDYALSWVEQLVMFRDRDVGTGVREGNHPVSIGGHQVHVAVSVHVPAYNRRGIRGALVVLYRCCCRYRRYKAAHPRSCARYM